MNWAREYDDYKRTAEVTQTRFGGSETLPSEKAKANPWLTRMFAGYAFAIDYRDRRGHAYMLQDQEQTKRVTERPQPGACLQCHTSVIPTYRRLGGGDVFKGFEALGKLPYAEAHAEVVKTGSSNPVAGRTTATFQHERRGASGELRGLSRSEKHGTARDAARVHPRHPGAGVRPGARRRTSRASSAGGTAADRTPYDPNVDASRQEMRSFVCGQCHVEYYCGPKTTLFYPWNNGLKVEQIESVLRQLQVPRRPHLLRLDARRDRGAACSRRSIPSSRPGARASTRAAASRAPTATCPTSARAR